MTAAYRLKGIGWMAVLVGIVLGFYLVSLRVAAERKKLDAVNARIETAQRDIRALETEFDTRANLAQLERWNGDTLALVAPGAAQFVRDDAQLAAIDPNRTGDPAVQTAAMVVPSAPVVVMPAGAPVAAAAQTAVASPAAMPTQPRGAEVPARSAVQSAMQAVALAVAPAGQIAPGLARLAEVARGEAAVARVRPQAVAMLDRKLLSDTTFGDIMSGARAEARARR